MPKKKAIEKKKEEKKTEEKDPYDEALEILQKYEEGNPPIAGEPED